MVDEKTVIISNYIYSRGGLKSWALIGRAGSWFPVSVSENEVNQDFMSDSFCRDIVDYLDQREVRRFGSISDLIRATPGLR